MLFFINNPDLRKRMGENARKVAIRDFSKELVTDALLKYYEMLISKLTIDRLLMLSKKNTILIAI